MTRLSHGYILQYTIRWSPQDDGTWDWSTKKNLPVNGALALVTDEP